MWEASQQYLQYLVTLLTAASTAHDTLQQRQIAKSMEDFCLLPESDLYLLLILTSPIDTGVPETIRSMAGLILKNNLKRRDTIPEDTIKFMQKCHLLDALDDRTHLVKSTTGTLLATIANRLGRKLSVAWPSLLPDLLEKIHHHNGGVGGVAAAEAIAKICEDAADELVSDPGEPVNSLIPALISILGADHVEDGIRVASLNALNCFILQDCSLDQFLENLLGVLSMRAAKDNSNEMKRAICQSLNLLLEGFPDQMKPTLPSVLEYMLSNVNRHNDESVALEACEFWLALAERDSATDLVSAILPRLIPTLMANIVYADDDSDLEANEEEASTPDRVQDMKPRHHSAILHSEIDESGKDREEGELGGEEGEEEEEESEDDDDNYGSWTLRKCSAATLDILSSTVPEQDIVPILLPLINHSLSGGDWKEQEAGILALGAISEGCMDTITPHLPQLVPFLVQSISSPVPLVRAISAWTLSRYSTHIDDHTPVAALIRALVDGNKKVQQAACTSLGVFAEKAPSLHLPLFPDFIKASQWALAHYQVKNLIVLYDTLGTVADTLENKEIVKEFQHIIPQLLDHWVQTPENEPSLLALLECICSIAIVAGPLFVTYAKDILQKTAWMIDNVFEATINHRNSYIAEEIDFDPCMVALDLIGGLVQGMGESLSDLLISMEPDLKTILGKTMQVPHPQVRQSVFALIGDLSLHCPMPLSPHVQWIVPILGANINPMTESASHGSSNNSVWALGEISLRFPSVAPLLPPILSLLCECMILVNTQRSYLENVAIAIGRSLILIPPSAELPVILPRWTQIMSLVMNPHERESAWRPMVAILCSQPQLINRDAVVPLLKAIDKYRNASVELESGFNHLFRLIRDQLLGVEGWNILLNGETLTVINDLEHRFHL